MWRWLLLCIAWVLNELSSQAVAKCYFGENNGGEAALNKRLRDKYNRDLFAKCAGKQKGKQAREPSPVQQNEQEAHAHAATAPDQPAEAQALEAPAGKELLDLLPGS